MRWFSIRIGGSWSSEIVSEMKMKFPKLHSEKIPNCRVISVRKIESMWMDSTIQVESIVMDSCVGVGCILESEQSKETSSRCGAVSTIFEQFFRLFKHTILIPSFSNEFKRCMSPWILSVDTYYDILGWETTVTNNGFQNHEPKREDGCSHAKMKPVQNYQSLHWKNRTCQMTSVRKLKVIWMDSTIESEPNP